MQLNQDQEACFRIGSLIVMRPASEPIFVCLIACFEFAPKSLLWHRFGLDILLYFVSKLLNCNVF